MYGMALSRYNRLPVHTISYIYEYLLMKILKTCPMFLQRWVWIENQQYEDSSDVSEKNKWGSKTKRIGVLRSLCGGEWDPKTVKHYLRTPRNFRRRWLRGGKGKLILWENLWENETAEWLVRQCSKKPKNMGLMSWLTDPSMRFLRRYVVGVDWVWIMYIYVYLYFCMYMYIHVYIYTYIYV